MYHPTTRVLTVLALLQTHGRMTGTELARRLEVNARTLRRYIVMLQDLGIPIETERGRYGAYILSAGYKLPPMMFTNEEALALTVGLISARRLNLTHTGHAIESAFAKLERVLPLELKSRMRALTETITFGMDAASSTPPHETILSTLTEATQSQKRVHLQYQSRQDETSERDLDPYGLTYFQSKWYVIGFCHLRQEMRSFRLDRITAIQALPEHFERPAGFDPLAYITQAIATLPRTYPFELTLKTDLETAQKEVFDVLGILEAEGGHITLRGSVDDLAWLARQIAMFSFEFVIQEPKELKDEVEKVAEKLRMAAG